MEEQLFTCTHEHLCLIWCLLPNPRQNQTLNKKKPKGMAFGAEMLVQVHSSPRAVSWHLSEHQMPPGCTTACHLTCQNPPSEHLGSTNAALWDRTAHTTFQSEQPASFRPFKFFPHSSFTTQYVHSQLIQQLCLKQYR